MSLVGQNKVYLLLDDAKMRSGGSGGSGGSGF